MNFKSTKLDVWDPNVEVNPKHSIITISNIDVPDQMNIIDNIGITDNVVYYQNNWYTVLDYEASNSDTVKQSVKLYVHKLDIFPIDKE